MSGGGGVRGGSGVKVRIVPVGPVWAEHCIGTEINRVARVARLARVARVARVAQ